MLCSCTTIKPSTTSVAMKELVTDQAALSPCLAVSKVVLVQMLQYGDHFLDFRFQFLL